MSEILGAWLRNWRHGFLWDLRAIRLGFYVIVSAEIDKISKQVVSCQKQFLAKEDSPATGLGERRWDTFKEPKNNIQSVGQLREHASDRKRGTGAKATTRRRPRPSQVIDINSGIGRGRPGITTIGGYPARLSEGRIPIIGRIVSACDVRRRGLKKGRQTHAFR